jgi:glutaredoxin
VDGEALTKAAARSGREAEAPAPEPIKPPFDVSGEADGLLLVWYDQEGLHTATKRSEIPEARRGAVRVDSLKVAPDARLDADSVYVADLRSPGNGGQYPVRKASRSWFDAQVDREKPAPPVAAQSDVVIYMASWCGACRGAAEYLRGRKVPFVEKDVEKDPAAAAEMQQKASAKGLSPRGVPVIDFRGDIMLGFDQHRLSTLIDASGAGGKPI